MAKKRISSADLGWIISDQLFELQSSSRRVSVAVVPDERNGWRVIVGNRDRGHLTAVDEQRLADIQRRLREIYELEAR
jgi:hypothetical protein